MTRRATIKKGNVTLAEEPQSVGVSMPVHASSPRLAAQSEPTEEYREEELEVEQEDESIVPLFADFPEPPLARDVGSISIAKFNPDTNERHAWPRPHVDGVEWTPNPYTITEEEIAKLYGPGIWMVALKGADGRIMSPSPRKVIVGGEKRPEPTPAPTPPPVVTPAPVDPLKNMRDAFAIFRELMPQTTPAPAPQFNPAGMDILMQQNMQLMQQRLQLAEERSAQLMNDLNARNNELAQARSSLLTTEQRLREEASDRERRNEAQWRKQLEDVENMHRGRLEELESRYKRKLQEQERDHEHEMQRLKDRILNLQQELDTEGDDDSDDPPSPPVGPAAQEQKPMASVVKEGITEAVPGIVREVMEGLKGLLPSVGAPPAVNGTEIATR